MNTTKIKWRLANRPTPDEVSLLHKDGLLTKEEAREILFSLETDEDRDKKTLEAEIKFLREIVEKLSSNPARIVEVIREIAQPWRAYPWYQPYYAWCGTTTSLAQSAGGGGAGASYTLTAGGSSSTLLNTSVTATGSNSTSTGIGQHAPAAFSSISTFKS